MRVYNRDDFLKLPAGTLYAKGVQWAFDGLMVKADTWGDDWVCLNVQDIEAFDSGENCARLDEMLEAGASYPMNDAYGRDGYFDKDAVFLVYERDDLLKLQNLISAALAKS